MRNRRVVMSALAVAASMAWSLISITAGAAPPGAPSAPVNPNFDSNGVDPASPADGGVESAKPTDKSAAPETETSNVTVRATPIFGNEAAMGSGWSEVAVSLENAGGSARRGTIELASQMSWSNREEFVARAPFNVASGRSVVVKLPTHGSRSQSPNLAVRVTDQSGKLLAATSLGSIPFGAPLLVDVHQPSRLAPTLRNWPLTTKWSPTRTPYVSSTTTGPGLTVGVPTFDRATGDPILPDRAAGYSSATVVLIHTDVLARLEPSAADALVNWVVTGGTLALVPTRIEDLRGPTVAALVGGAAAPAPPPPALMSLPTRPRPPAAGLFPADPLQPDDPPAPLLFESGGSPPPFIPIRTAQSPSKVEFGPTPAIRAKLQGYAGGNLSPSVFGSSAAYGTGEVHLLAFDPTEQPMLEDPWVHARLLDLVEHAWDRRSVNVIAHGGGEHDAMNFDGVRRALDPNENFRPALGVAAILLVLYSIVAGPLTFLRAARKGKPLSPLTWAPVFSAVTFLAIVVVGLAVKGWHGKSRHLALVEMESGMGRGAIRRFRGFFTSESRALSIPSTDAASVLSVVSADSLSSQDKSSLSLDRNGAALEDINALPWQTIVVQEDGLYDFKGGVSITAGKEGSLDVANHTGHTLKNVLIFDPADGVHYVEQLLDGGKVHASDTQKLLAAGAFTGTPGPSSPTHELSIELVAAAFGSSGGKHPSEIRSAWDPMGGALGSYVDWWPDSVPVVLAEAEGGEGSKRDGTLPLESDRLLVRVIGRGGAS